MQQAGLRDPCRVCTGQRLVTCSVESASPVADPPTPPNHESWRHGSDAAAEWKSRGRGDEEKRKEEEEENKSRNKMAAAGPMTRQGYRFGAGVGGPFQTCLSAARQPLHRASFPARVPPHTQACVMAAAVIFLHCPAHPIGHSPPRLRLTFPRHSPPNTLDSC